VGLLLNETQVSFSSFLCKLCMCVIAEVDLLSLIGPQRLANLSKDLTLLHFHG